MEVELEPRVKPLSFKVKGMSRESAAQKASHVLDTDLRNHWSTATNTKEWILLELDEPCLLSHIRIYNKSVLEWEISVGLRYKPETFVKVRPRCEAPRRDMMYPMNYTACKYVRISCLRGNPIAIFFIQLIGVSVTGLEPDFQPVVNYLLPHIISHKQDAYDLHLQLLQDLTNRLVMFLPQLEADLSGFADAAESTIRFLAMLAGPLYPILNIVNERETARLAGSTSDFEASKNSLPSLTLTISSNFEPRRSRNALPNFFPTSSSLVFRPDAVLLLLRKAYKDSHLGTVCRMASRVLLKLAPPMTMQEASLSSFEFTTSVSDETSNSEPSNSLHAIDYSNLFGEEFRIPDEHWDSKYLDVLDIKAVEEGVLHVLYACASQPLHCSKLAESSSDFWSALPLVQALLPALRPNATGSDKVDGNFSQWKQPFVQHALSQIVGMSSSSVYRPLLHGCAGYLASFSPSHAKAACVLIDLCSGVLAPWVAQVIAKVDLAVELVEDLLGVIQGARHAVARACAALRYIMLALSGHMDDMMGKFKEVKHRILFLVMILEPFLDPAITPLKSMIAFGNVSPIFLENQERNCAVALNVIRTAVRKSAVLPSLESQWRRGSVAPSVLLSILEPHMQLPPNIDLCKLPISEVMEPPPGVSPLSSVPHYGGATSKLNSHDVADGKIDASDTIPNMDIIDDASLLFAPPEVRGIALANASGIPDQKSSDLRKCNDSTEEHLVEKSVNNKFHQGEGADTAYAVDYSDFHADYFHLMNYRDCDLWASEFRHLALDLHSQNDITPECHIAAIDALLLAAECYINPFFIMSFRDHPKFRPKTNISRTSDNHDIADIRRDLEKNDKNLETVARLERKRDRTVLQILLEAAELDQKYQQMVSPSEDCPSHPEAIDDVINLSQRDMTSIDAITLVRQNQALLCKFLIDCLIRERQSMREILMQSLVFLLHSATKLYCAPEHVIDIILESAEYLNGLLSSYYYQSREGKLPLDLVKLNEAQRHWMLLQKLVIASSGGDGGSDISMNMGNGVKFANLIPPSAWIEKIPTFSSSASPLVRFIGWMAVSRNAQQFQTERLFLASDLTQLTNLLSIFADELAVIDDIVDLKAENKQIEGSVKTAEGHEHPGQQYGDLSFRSIYPDVCRFFPSIKKQFNTFGENILVAIGLQLKSLASSVVPDLLCWFSDLCSWPFLQKDQPSSKSAYLCKGFLTKNAKAIIVYILEAIVIEHMEAMVPEVPRVVQVLVSLCRTSYCDVTFLDSVLGLLKPIISYSLTKVSDEEKLVVEDSCVNFEALCFDELFSNINRHYENERNPDEKVYSRAPTILVLASVFPDLSLQRKHDILQSLVLWADFASFEPTTSFYDYLSAFQAVLESCKLLLVENLRVLNIIPLDMAIYSSMNDGGPCDDNSESSLFLNDAYNRCCPAETCGENERIIDSSVILDQKARILAVEEVEDFCKDLEVLISKINPTIEFCYKLHHRLAKKLTFMSAECFVYLRCLSSVSKRVAISPEIEQESLLPSKPVDHFPRHWEVSLEGLAEMVGVLQENNCWEVSSIILDCLLGVPRYFALDNVIGSVCSAVKKISCSAPKISWRLQTDKWLSLLVARGIQNLHESESPLFDLLCSMLGHPEPEQRFLALKHLEKLVGQDVDGGTMFQSSSYLKSTSPGLDASPYEPVTSPLVSSMWDLVTVLASSDVSLLLRTRAMALLVNFAPFAERGQLQSLLAAADSILPGLIDLGHRTCGGPVAKLSLAVIARACLYCPAEDICLIPQSVWRSIETIGMTEIEIGCGDLEVEVCQALCRLKSEGFEAKGIIHKVLLSTSTKQDNPEFGSTRESLLKVLACLTSIQSYFDLFSEKNDEKLMEIEEAEIEMDLLQKEQSLQPSNDLKDLSRLPFLAGYVKDDKRLQEIKDGIRTLEKAKLKEEIIARRQKKLLMRRARQKYLEEAAVHEAELLQELDRERTSEAEKEIERQRMLEVERAKTRELRHNLDMEKEKQTQRELQRELEQAESGLRPSRREFSSSTHSSRPRERYRERENGRSTNEGSLRTSSGSLQPDISNPSSSMSAMPTVVLTGSRQFSGQLPTILQSRDRTDEGGSSYEENFDGSRDSGDTGSIGDPDPDPVSALEGQSGGFGSGQRHGSRGSKSRQMVERIERDGRRGGKWERKH